MVKYQILVCLLFFVTILTAQDKTVKVWPNGASDDNGMTAPEEKFNGVWVRNVSEAEMYLYMPENR